MRENIQFITRNTNLDCGHRVMNEKMKCFNVHGHTYLTELTFSFKNMEEIGYAIDFKELKRVFVEFLQEYFDHGMLLNPKDTKLIETTKELGSKLWLMSLNGEGEYCNPTVENVAKEAFLAMDILSKTLYAQSKTGLLIHRVRMYETPNCFTDCYRESITKREKDNFHKSRRDLISNFAKKMGVLEYDDRKSCDVLTKLDEVKELIGTEPIPDFPQPPLETYLNECSVCGLKLEGVMGYVCQRGKDCPTGLAGPTY